MTDSRSGQAKDTMSLEHLVPKTKKAMQNSQNYVKRTQEQPEGAPPTPLGER